MESVKFKLEFKYVKGAKVANLNHNVHSLDFNLENEFEVRSITTNISNSYYKPSLSFINLEIL